MMMVSMEMELQVMVVYGATINVDARDVQYYFYAEKY